MNTKKEMGRVLAKGVAPALQRYKALNFKGIVIGGSPLVHPV